MINITLRVCLDGEKKLEGRKLRGKKLSGKKYSEFVFSIAMFGWKENDFSHVCLCGKVKGKKKVILSDDNFTLILLEKVFQLY